jgi:hypothetical protein
VSVYDAADSIWSQAWVDNQGSFLQFAGRLWQRSPEGDEWETLWTLAYSRLEGPAPPPGR